MLDPEQECFWYAVLDVAHLYDKLFLPFLVLDDVGGCEEADGLLHTAGQVPMALYFHRLIVQIILRQLSHNKGLFILFFKYAFPYFQ